MPNDLYDDDATPVNQDHMIGDNPTNESQDDEAVTQEASTKETSNPHDSH